MIIKICGVTTPADAQTAARLGAAMIGLNFYERSPRFIDDARAAEILAVLPPSVTPVAVGVQPSADLLSRWAALGFRAWQLHDADPKVVLNVASRPERIMLAIGVANAADRDKIAEELQRWRAAGVSPSAVLLDARVPGMHGGTGKTLPWQLVEDFDVGVPIILAGGLTPENVAEAIRIVRPFGVDVAGGVESAPGIKDADKVRRFVEAARP